MNISKLVGIIDNHLGIRTPKQSIVRIKGHVEDVESKFCHKEGTINLMRRRLDHMEAMRNLNFSERAGYVFKGPGDSGALCAMAKDSELYRCFLDIVSYLQVTKAPFTSYESGIKVHINSIKAEFKSMSASQVKIFFKISYPETILRVVDTETDALCDGVKWPP